MHQYFVNIKVLLLSSVSSLPSTPKAFKHRFSEDFDYRAPERSRPSRCALKCNKLAILSCTFIWFAPALVTILLGGSSLTRVLLGFSVESPFLINFPLLLSWTRAACFIQALAFLWDRTSPWKISSHPAGRCGGTYYAILMWSEEGCEDTTLSV